MAARISKRRVERVEYSFYENSKQQYSNFDCFVMNGERRNEREKERNVIVFLYSFKGSVFPCILFQNISVRTNSNKLKTISNAVS